MSDRAAVTASVSRLVICWALPRAAVGVAGFFAWGMFAWALLGDLP